MTYGTDQESDLGRDHRAATLASNVTVSLFLLASAWVVIWLMGR